jgi:phenylalanyl-tRNA synthetase beta chain
LNPVELARLLTMIGLEVEEIHLVGLAGDSGAARIRVTGLSWDPDKIVVAQIDEVLPHPNADRLVLCRCKDGQQEHIVLTGAPNLFEYKGRARWPSRSRWPMPKKARASMMGTSPGRC